MTPDLTILGKVIGGGLPAAAYAGRRDLMERIAPAGDVYQAGTLSGNPLAVAAGLATLRPARRRRVRAARPRRRRGSSTGSSRSPASRRGRACRCRSITGLFTVFFSDEPVHDYEGAKSADAERYGAFCRALLERGVYPPASQFEAWFPSLAHDDEHIEQTLNAVEAAFSLL